MEQNYEYIVNNDEVTLTRYTGHELEVELPQYIDNLPLTRIGDYAFRDLRNMKEVTLPVSVKEIGSHAFYNCIKLKTLKLYDFIYMIEDGAFKNCEALKIIEMQMRSGKTTCIKKLLTETNQELHITLYYDHKKEDEVFRYRAKLIFPKCMDDFVENTEARMINQIYYGAGVRYRECLTGKDIDYRKYDQIFEYSISNDTKEIACLIAMNRLAYPYELSKKAKKCYEKYLQKELLFLMERLLKEKDMKTIQLLARISLFKETNIDEMIDLAYRMEQIEAIRYLLEYKQTHFGLKEKTFEL